MYICMCIYIYIYIHLYKSVSTWSILQPSAAPPTPHLCINASRWSYAFFTRHKRTEMHLCLFQWSRTSSTSPRKFNFWGPDQFRNPRDLLRCMKCPCICKTQTCLSFHVGHSVLTYPPRTVAAIFEKCTHTYIFMLVMVFWHILHGLLLQFLRSANMPNSTCWS